MNNKTPLALLAVVLAACGTTPTTGTTTTLVSGPIGALASDGSSMTVAGRVLKLSGLQTANSTALQTLGASSQVRVNGKDANRKALGVGRHVRASVDDKNNVKEVDVDLELKGKIESVDATASTLMVAGKTVKVSLTTRIDLHLHESDDNSTAHTIADLSVGAFVEVTGNTDSAGVVQANKIEVRNKSELDESGEDDHLEFKGMVGGFDASKNSFTLGKYTVVCAAPCMLPTGLKNGDMVEVKGTPDAAGTTLNASRVHFEDNNEDHHGLPGGSSGVLEDDIHTLDSSAKTFVLKGFTVDYASATVTGTLANDAVVRVEGNVDANNTKVFHATSVTVLSKAEDDHGGGHH